jgi:DNA-binding NtrC family response regulator
VQQPGGEMTYFTKLRLFQKELITEALKQNDYNVTQTAKALDLNRAYFYKLMAKCGHKRIHRECTHGNDAWRELGA